MTRSADFLMVLEFEQRSHSTIPKFKQQILETKKLSVSGTCCEIPSSRFILLKYNGLTFTSNETSQVPLWTEV